MTQADDLRTVVYACVCSISVLEAFIARAANMKIFAALP